MNSTVTAAALLIAAYSLLADPARAQPQDRAPAGRAAACVFREPASATPAPPTKDWSQVPAAPRKLTAGIDPEPAGTAEPAVSRGPNADSERVGP